MFRSWAMLGATLALAGCAGQAPLAIGPAAPLPAMTGGMLGPAPAAPTADGGPARPVAVLLPLTGAMAPAGEALQNAVRLAFAGATTPVLDIRDTTGTAAGAAAAARAAIAAGDGLMLGPLTSGEAHAVAPIAAAAGINVLAFTNDSGVDAAGIWALGVTPAQQVQRVVQFAAAAGHNQIAALLPDSQFGHALGAALATAAAGNGATIGATVYYEDGNFGSINQAVQQVSDFANRGQPIEDKIKAAQELNTQAGRDTADQLQHQPIPPPSFTALLIGATSAETLAEMATLLPYYDVTQPQVQFLGSAIWAQIEPQIAASGVYDGALYAAPDPAAAASFSAKYQAAYGTAPPAIADVAFDAAAIARLAAAAGYATGTLTSPSGFTGTDGALLLAPDGQVLRGLAVFAVAAGGASIASPAPAQVTAPAS